MNTPSHTPEAESEDRSPLVLSVIKAFALLETIAAAPDGLALRDLSRQNELHPSTAHRLLHTLIHIGYVRQNSDTRRYYLGQQIHGLATPTRKSFTLQDTAMPHLRRLSGVTKEVASLYALEGSEVLHLAQAESPQAVQLLTPIGARLPVHCTASGKVLLANLPDTERNELLASLRLENCTPNTITQLDDLQVDLDRIRRRGYAVDDEEQELGVRGVAAPVRDAQGKTIAAVSIAGPSGRISVHRLAEFAQMTQDAAADVSQELGQKSAALQLG